MIIYRYGKNVHSHVRTLPRFGITFFIFCFIILPALLFRRVFFLPAFWKCQKLYIRYLSGKIIFYEAESFHLRQHRTKIVPKMRRQIFCQIVQKFCRHTVVCQEISVQDHGKYASRFGAGCPQHTKKSSRKAQTDWIVLQMPLGYRKAVFVRCCLKNLLCIFS